MVKVLNLRNEFGWYLSLNLRDRIFRDHVLFTFRPNIN